MTLTVPWLKVVRDIWRERTRALLVVLAIAVGLTGFLAVLTTYAILRRELDRGYLATNPASAVMVTDRVDDALLARIVARDDVEDADARRVVTGRLQTPDGSWRRLMLFVIRDFGALRISTVTSEAGAWPPGPGELLVERDAFQVSKTPIGEEAAIETRAGGRHALRVAGRVHDAGQAQARMENMVYGYISPQTLALIGEPSDLDRLYLLASGNRFGGQRIRQMANDVKVALEQGGHVVQRVDVLPPGEHPHAAIMGLLLLLMDAFGMFALVLSGVIVLNLLLGMLASERRQIGVMKAIGASRGQIARVYLAEAGVLGVGALVFALPLGIILGRMLSRYFALLLNFDLISVSVPFWVSALTATVGLIVPLGAAAYPVALARARRHSASAGSNGWRRWSATAVGRSGSASGTRYDAERAPL
jgi:putative ABC transport system permease protein